MQYVSSPEPLYFTPASSEGREGEITNNFGMHRREPGVCEVAVRGSYAGLAARAATSFLASRPRNT